MCTYAIFLAYLFEFCIYPYHFVRARKTIIPVKVNFLTPGQEKFALLLGIDYYNTMSTLEKDLQIASYLKSLVEVNIIINFIFFL